jgi:hypothetical protein
VRQGEVVVEGRGAGRSDFALSKPTLIVLLQRRADECEGGFEITEHELSADADDAKASALQRAVTTGVGA